MNEDEVQRDTRLTPGQQEARALRARQWATRVHFLMFVAGADVRLALKAIEDADQPQERQRGA